MMPYIKKEDRPQYDKDLDPLIQTLLKNTAFGQKNTGHSVYCLYKILRIVYELGNFEAKSNVYKILKSCENEFNKNVMDPYEEIKKKENGDVVFESN